MNLREIIKNHLLDVLKNQNIELKNQLKMDSVLLQTGLDSLGFAILVATLEEKLGYDPFQLMENPTYPKTLKDFIDCYEKFKPRSK